MNTDRATLIQSLRRFPSQLEALTGRVHPHELTVAYIPSEWTVAQIVHHVADSHLNAYTRMRLILTEDHPSLKPYDQERWAELADAKISNINTSLQIIHGLHQRWSTFLEQVTSNEWARTGEHPEHGSLRLDQLLEMYVNHGIEHLEQISRILAARPLITGHTFRYEVIVDIAPHLAHDYQQYMRNKHIPEILATGHFRHIQFDQSTPTRFRTAYVAASQAAIDLYLHEHATHFRNDFLAHFPEGASANREIWVTQTNWSGMQEG